MGNPEDNGDEDEVDDSEPDDNDSDDEEGTASGDDGEVVESEEDDQDTEDDESTENPDDGDMVDDEDTDSNMEVEDECVGLDADECGNSFGDDGGQLCGYNTQTADCYEVVERVGIRGRGNFDDGWSAAQAEADVQATQLYTAIGILGGILVLLVLTVLGGIYYIYSTRKHVEYRHTAVPHDIIDVDGGSRTNGQHTRIESHSVVHHETDSTPMLE